MLNLIANERKKIKRQKSNLFMKGIVILIIIAMAFIIRISDDYKKQQDDWKQQLQSELKQNEMYLQEGDMPESAKKQISSIIEKDEYKLEHNISPSPIWNFVEEASGLISLVMLFTIIVAGGSVANEFSWGTIKLLLIRPANRSKILLSKYLATFTYAIELLLILFVVSFLVGGVFFSFDQISQPFFNYVDGKIVEENMVIHIFKQYGLNSVMLLMMVTVSFMISTVFRSSAIAIGLSIFLSLTGAGLVELFSKFEWSKYILFANTDLTQYFDGVPLHEGMTLGFSITVLAIYFIIFNLVSWFIFNKRDVAA